MHQIMLVLHDCFFVRLWIHRAIFWRREVLVNIQLRIHWLDSVQIVLSLLPSPFVGVVFSSKYLMSILSHIVN